MGGARQPLPARAGAARKAATRSRVSAARGAANLLPSSRSLAVGFALLALAVGAYAIARESSMFAIESVEVRGASPATAAALRHALEPLRGTSLLALGADDVE